MHSQRHHFFQALTITSSLPGVIFVCTFIQHLQFSLFFFLLASALEIYFMSAFAGCILEIIISRETNFTIRRLNHNAKDLWTGFLIFFMLAQLTDFLLFFFFHSYPHWRAVSFAVIDTVGALSLAPWAIRKKFAGRLGDPSGHLRFQAGAGLVFMAACLLGMFCIKIFAYFHWEGFQARFLLNSISNFISVFEFIFCTLFILDSYPEAGKEQGDKPEIFLVNPLVGGIFQGIGLLFLRRQPPFFVVLKALTPSTYRFREFNQVIWRDQYYKSNVLVCITCMTSNCYEAYKIAKEFKKRGAVVIMGGPHVTCFPSEALVFCDSVVVGPAEGIWNEVIQGYENKTLRPIYMQESETLAEEDYARTHKALLNLPPSTIKDFMETTRGCKFSCRFCSIPGLVGDHRRFEPIENIVALIKKINDKRSIIRFLDNNVYTDPRYARELFKAVKPLGIKWDGSCSLDIAQNQESLSLAKESGCVELLLGYEIFARSVEKSQGGKFVMAPKYAAYTQIIKQAGIRVKAHFIFGFDSDGLKTLVELWKFCFSIKPHLTLVSILTPLPGSALYHDMLAQNRLINLNWRSYNCQQMVFRHAHLKPGLLSSLHYFMANVFLLTTSISGFWMLGACGLSLLTWRFIFH